MSPIEDGGGGRGSPSSGELLEQWRGVSGSGGKWLRKAITKAGIERTIRPCHDLRHTALTHDAAAGNAAVYVQARAGHAQATMTERYVHAAQVAFPGAAEKAEARLLSGVDH